MDVVTMAVFLLRTSYTNCHIYFLKMCCIHVTFHIYLAYAQRSMFTAENVFFSIGLMTCTQLSPVTIGVLYQNAPLELC
jgi:hypothetical protein